MIRFRVGDSSRFTALHTCHHELMSAFAVFLQDLPYRSLPLEARHTPEPRQLFSQCLEISILSLVLRSAQTGGILYRLLRIAKRQEKRPLPCIDLLFDDFAGFNASRQSLGVRRRLSYGFGCGPWGNRSYSIQDVRPWAPPVEDGRHPAVGTGPAEWPVIG